MSLQYVDFRTRDGRIEYESFPLMCLPEKHRPTKEAMDSAVEDSGLERGTLEIRRGTLTEVF